MEEENEMHEVATESRNALEAEIQACPNMHLNFFSVNEIFVDHL